LENVGASIWIKRFRKALIFITVCGEGYASELSRFFGMKIFPIQNQLDKFEAGGIFVSTTQG
jgi:hypothetical protein